MFACAFVEGIRYLTPLSAPSLLVYPKATDFCMGIECSPTLLHSWMSSARLVGESVLFSTKTSKPCAKRERLTSLPILMPLFPGSVPGLMPGLVALCGTMVVRVYTGHPPVFLISRGKLSGVPH